MVPTSEQYAHSMTMHEAAGRLLSLALAVCTDSEEITKEMVKEYARLRRIFVDSEDLRGSIPQPIQNSRNLDGLAVWLRSERRTADGRADLLTRAFAPFQAAALKSDQTVYLGSADSILDPSAWTGLQTRSQRLIMIRSLIPTAMDAVETLIEDLGQPGNNGGPILDDRDEAIVQLRLLHSQLGQILSAIDNGQFDDELGQGLAADAVRYSVRISDTLKNDPMPYAVSTLVLAIFTACGFPGAGGLAASMALKFTNPRK